MEALVRLAAKPIAYAASAAIFVGLLYLGIRLKDGAAGGREFVRGLALIAAGAAVLFFISLYGFEGF